MNNNTEVVPLHINQCEEKDLGKISVKDSGEIVQEKDTPKRVSGAQSNALSPIVVMQPLWLDTQSV